MAVSILPRKTLSIVQKHILRDTYPEILILSFFSILRLEFLLKLFHVFLRGCRKTFFRVLKMMLLCLPLFLKQREKSLRGFESFVAFGPLPPPVRYFMTIIYVVNLCCKATRKQ